LDELAVVKYQADGSFRKLIQKYKKIDLLILDKWLLTDLSEENVLYVLEIVEARLKKASTIFCSQFSPEGWHSKLGQKQIADAILDRIFHDSYI
jgi:DNA replication protein DnaC